jgi:broad specificity phosphatase PhoE
MSRFYFLQRYIRRMQKGQRPLTLTHKIDFGGYKGETIEDVMGKDPAWLVWAHENIEFFKLPPELIQRARMFAISESNSKEVE